MILVDFSQIAIGAITMFMEELKKGSDQELLDLSRHSIIASLVGYKKKHGATYGELVIACDSNDYWRTDVFPQYKATRKASKETSDIPWDKVYYGINTVRQELIDNFPWKTLHVPKCEGDDIIAVMTKFVQENQLSTSGIFDEPQPVLIVAADTDDVQLTQFDGVRQWCPLQKKFLTKLSKVDLKKFMIEHIVKGDVGDGVPNIHTRDDFFVTKEEGERQRSVTQNMLDLVFEYGIDGIDRFPRLKKEIDIIKKNGKPGKGKIEESDEDFNIRISDIKTRYNRNSRLVIFDHIPTNIRDSIISHYNEKPKGSKDMVRKYFIKNRCKLLMEDLSSI